MSLIGIFLPESMFKIYFLSDQGDGMEKLRAEQYGRVKHDAEILKITRAGECYVYIVNIFFVCFTIF